ncbi:hypothetical protein MPH_05044 [Macrophomina phaseolina MS6]|uniref:Uncharacterized protein n=1 Tax=Macrophomina phaseolina (strain MS6) TaxID=1126212 RepID=K2RSN1_MACPH|nr:hypothetical protein MPH_05044 [Macrophomina phaseolina MS6]
MQKFQTAHSLYIQVSEEGFDDAQDDQWAIALEAIRPGNVQHNLKHVKIEVTGQALFSGYSAVLLSPSSSNNLRTRSVCMSARPNPTRLTEAMVASPSERAFIRALSNLRDIERVEITGPMEADLKKQLAVAMTTRHGQKVRDWRYGGGLRSDNDISLGTWSAAMKSADGEGDDGASEYRLNPFWRQSYLPRQPMQLLAYANFDPSRSASITQVESVGEGIIPKLPLDSGSGSSSAECDSKEDGPSGGEAGNSPGNTGHDARIGGTTVKKEDEENDEHKDPGYRGQDWSA